MSEDKAVRNALEILALERAKWVDLPPRTGVAEHDKERREWIDAYDLAMKSILDAQHPLPPAVPSDPAEPSAALALVDRLIGDNTKLDASRPVTYADLRQLRAALRTASSAPAREQVEALPSYEYTEDCMELVSDGSPGHSFKGKWIERGAVLALFPAAARSPSPEKAR